LIEWNEAFYLQPYYKICAIDRAIENDNYMEQYKNLGGNSGVLSYEIGFDSLIVQFRDGGTYLYDRRSPGNNDLERMKSLAVSGIGLNSYISKYVRKNYTAKLR
jgi:hypothetical protein